MERDLGSRNAGSERSRPSWGALPGETALRPGPGGGAPWDGEAAKQGLGGGKRPVQEGGAEFREEIKGKMRNESRSRESAEQALSRAVGGVAASPLQGP